MKNITTENVRFPFVGCPLARALIIAGFLSAQPPMARAMDMPPGFRPPTNTPIASWSFFDSTNWTSDQGYPPVSYTNLAFSYLGEFASVVVSTNVPAWLNFNVVEPSTGATNLVLEAPGSLAFWYAPADWSSTNAGGTGPGEWAQLIGVGEWTPDGSYGYWGLSIDPPGTNLWLLAQDGDGDTYGLSAPISWTTNYFHCVCLTYSSTNVSIYIDGALAANDPGGLSIWPGTDAISGGIWFGSDTNGLMQADGFLDTIAAYGYPLAANDVQRIFDWNYLFYDINPFNSAMNGAAASIASAPSSPSTNSIAPDAITGPGQLQWTNAAAVAIYSPNVWLANFTATAAAGGTMNVTFTIQGGSNGVPYDVFANSVLSFGSNGVPWAWMGQGTNRGVYTLNISSGDAFLILGTPQDSSGSDLTDAYQLLVSKTNPSVTNSDLDGIPTGWEILLGLNPTNSNLTSPAQRSNYGYTPADWLNGVSGIRSGSITSDPEGNVLQVSQ